MGQISRWIYIPWCSIAERDLGQRLIFRESFVVPSRRSPNFSDARHSETLNRGCHVLPLRSFSLREKLPLSRPCLFRGSDDNAIGICDVWIVRSAGTLVEVDGKRLELFVNYVAYIYDREDDSSHQLLAANLFDRYFRPQQGRFILTRPPMVYSW